MGVFAKGDFIKSSDVANLLGISTRKVSELFLQWSHQGWLEVADPSRREWRYRLTKTNKSLVGKDHPPSIIPERTPKKTPPNTT